MHRAITDFNRWIYRSDPSLKATPGIHINIEKDMLLCILSMETSEIRPDNYLLKFLSPTLGLGWFYIDQKDFPRWLRKIEE